MKKYTIGLSGNIVPKTFPNGEPLTIGTPFRLASEADAEIEEWKASMRDVCSDLVDARTEIARLRDLLVESRDTIMALTRSRFEPTDAMPVPRNLMAEKIDAALSSSPQSDGWISVEDRLPVKPYDMKAWLLADHEGRIILTYFLPEYWASEYKWVSRWKEVEIPRPLPEPPEVK